MAEYLKLEFSAENTEQADTILNALLAEKLVTGGQIMASPARFLWKGAVTDMNYVTVWSFTTTLHKDAVIHMIRDHSAEEVPMIWFTPIDGNKELLSWIKETLA